MSQQDGPWQPPTDEEAQRDENAQDGGAPVDDVVGIADPEALGEEREEYPDPGSYRSPEEGERAIWNGETPDADLDTDGDTELGG